MLGKFTHPHMAPTSFTLGLVCGTCNIRLAAKLHQAKNPIL